MSTSCWQPYTKGMSEVGSVTWVASSMITNGNLVPFKLGSPALVHVAATTWAALRIDLTVFLFGNGDLALSLPSSTLFFSICPSNEMLRTGGATWSSFPIRMTRTPRLMSFSHKLSTARLVSATTRIGLCSLSLINRCWTISQATCVLPVPGGPCISVSFCSRDAQIALCWLEFSGVFGWMICCSTIVAESAATAVWEAISPFTLLCASVDDMARWECTISGSKAVLTGASLRVLKAFNDLSNDVMLPTSTSCQCPLSQCADLFKHSGTGSVISVTMLAGCLETLTIRPIATGTKTTVRGEPCFFIRLIATWLPIVKFFEAMTLVGRLKTIIQELALFVPSLVSASNGGDWRCLYSQHDILTKLMLVSQVWLHESCEATWKISHRRWLRTRKEKWLTYPLIWCCSNNPMWCTLLAKWRSSFSGEEVTLMSWSDGDLFEGVS